MYVKSDMGFHFIKLFQIFPLAAHVNLKDPNQKLLWRNDYSNSEIRDVIRQDSMLASLDDASVISSLMDNIRYLRSHVTIALAYGVEAKQTGIDLMTLLLRMKLDKLNSSSSSSRLYKVFKTDDYTIAYFNDSYCYVKLKKPKNFFTIFNSEL